MGRIMRNWSPDQLINKHVCLAPYVYTHKSNRSFRPALSGWTRAAGPWVPSSSAMKSFAPGDNMWLELRCLSCFKGSLQLFAIILMLDILECSLAFFKSLGHLDSILTCPSEWNSWAQAVGASMSQSGTRRSHFTFCRVPCKIHVGG